MRARTILAALAAAVSLSPRLAAARCAPARSGPYTLELVDEAGRRLPTFTHGGRTYVLGAPGARYLLRVHNGSAARVEVVASVDGLDVVDGRPASFEKRGYLVAPWSDLVVEGFRVDRATVAAFRFGSVARSYAALTGDARDVGVVGVAVFPERVTELRRLPPPPPPEEAAPGDAPRRSGAAGPPAAAPRALADAAREAEASRRPGLGTEFGEAHGSSVREVPFERASETPAAVIALRYDDRAGLVAAGVDVDGRDRRDEAALRARADPFRASRWAEPPPGWRRP